MLFRWLIRQTSSRLRSHIKEIHPLGVSWCRQTQATVPPIGGLKVITASGWFAARPSGTEDVYKLYAESFRGPEHLAAIQEQAREIVAAAID